MPTQITGGFERHPKTGQPHIMISDADLQAVLALQQKGFGQRSVPLGAMNALTRYRRARASAAGIETAGQRYERLRSEIQLHLRGGGDPRIREQMRRDQEVMKEKFLTPGAVHSDQFLTNVGVQYGNDAYIGDMLCPVTPVTKQTGTIPEWDKRNRLAAPDDALGDRGQANEIRETRSDTAYVTVGRGLQNSVPGTVLANQDAPYNEMTDLTEAIAELMMLRREIRIATLFGAAASYAAANTDALAAADRWDTATGGDPIANMQAADAALWTGRGPSVKIMWSSLDVYNVLSRHPDILSLFVSSGGGRPGLASPDMIAQFLGADSYLVGRARQDTANEGQTESYSRIWPDSWGIARVSTATTLRNAWFASTLRWDLSGAPMLPGAPIDGVISTQWYEARDGLAGCHYAKLASSEVQQVIANDTAYLWRTPIN